MKHGIGLQSSIWNNNLKSICLLVSFPLVIAGMIWAVVFAKYVYVSDRRIGYILWDQSIDSSNFFILKYWLVIVSVVGVWFAIAWFFHQRIINKKTKARPMERSKNPKVYNLLENLCISRGMKVPKLFIIDSDRLNAYASGITEKTYAVTLTRGLINTLEKDELEAVIAHELTHIINRDVRLLIISIIFVGIISVLSEMMVRSIWGRSRSRGDGDGKGKGIAIIIVIVVSALGYFFSILIRFALSRRREYLADAGAVELTKNSDALVRSLEKISGHSRLQDVDECVQQMMFDNQKSFLGIFATHPPLESRVAVLKNY